MTPRQLALTLCALICLPCAAQQTPMRATWTDPSTGLMWTGLDNGKDISWKNAVRYCTNLHLAGHHDWRLASLVELNNIYNKDAISPGLSGPHSTSKFTWHIRGDLFLTGEPWADKQSERSGYEAYFDFNEGRSNDDPTGFFYSYTGMRALCVRYSGAAPQNDNHLNDDLDEAAHWFMAANRTAEVFQIAEVYRNESPQQIEKATGLYRYLLAQTGHPEVRRAQMELGNLVLDGKYSAGNTPQAQALNLEWARIISQELLGQEEYKITVDYAISRPDLPKDQAMYLRFCKRAAAYNIDLAQSSYAGEIMSGHAPDLSGYDDVVWTRLAADKQTSNIVLLQALENGMSPQQHHDADAAYNAMLNTRTQYGAYYPLDDPLRRPAIATLPHDDPDAQLRTAFSLEASARTNPADYKKAMDLYRTVRDHREVDIRYTLGRNLLYGTNGLQKNPQSAKYWLQIAADRGSQPAKQLLAIQ